MATNISKNPELRYHLGLHLIGANLLGLGLNAGLCASNATLLQTCYCLCHGFTSRLYLLQCFPVTLFGALLLALTTLQSKLGMLLCNDRLAINDMVDKEKASDTKKTWLC